MSKKFLKFWVIKCNDSVILFFKNAIVSMEGSSAHWYIPVLSIVDQSLLNIHSSVLVKLESSSLRSPRAVVGIVNGLMEDERLKAFKVDKKPIDSFLDIVGLDEPIQELKETVELPFTQVIFKLNKLYI